MRIALLSREFPPETSWGGIGTFYADLAQGLRCAGHEVEVFTQGLEEEGRRLWKGIPVHRCLPRWYGMGAPRGGPLAGIPPRHLGIFAWALARAVARCFASRHAERPFQAVESHEHLGIGALIPRGVPHLVRYHTAYHVLVDRGLEPWPRSRLIRWLEGRAMGRADLRVAPTRFIDRLTREHFPSLREADLEIPLACRYPPLPVGELARKLPVVVFAGRLEERKQPLSAVRAFREVAEAHPDWTLELAGSDSPAQDGSSVWECCARELGDLASRCRYHGPLAEADLGALYRRASIALVPSTFESFGLVALEAMSYGCVPITSKETALEEVVADAGIQVAVGDVAALASQLDRLMGDATLRLALARRGLARCEKFFDRGEILERNIESFEYLVGSPDRPGRSTAA